MLRNREVETLPVSAFPEPPRPTPAIPALELDTQTALMANQQSVIGAGLVVTGEITGSESLKTLFIEGTIQGKINLSGCPVNVGFGGQVNADVIARHVVVNGQIRGNVRASERVEIRSAGSLTGNASAPRILIEDGAFIKGEILITKSEFAVSRSAESASRTIEAKPAEAEPRTAILIRPELQNAPIFSSLKSA